MYIQGSNNPGNAARDFYLQPFGGDIDIGSGKIELNGNGNAVFHNSGFTQLDVQTDRTADSSNIGGLRFLNASGNPQSAVYGYVGKRLGLLTDNKERLYINETGDVLIGGTLPDSPNISLDADGNITNNVSSRSTTIDGQAWQNSASFGGSNTNFMVANILRGDNTRSSAIGNNNTAGDLYFFNNVSGNKTTYMRLKNGGNLQLGTNLTNTAAKITLQPDGSAEFKNTVQVHSTTDAGDSNAFQTYNSSGVLRTSIGGNGTFIIRNAANDGNTIILDADGSGTFAGGKIVFNTTGSANFTGYVQANRTTEGSQLDGSFNHDAQFDVRTDGEVRIASSTSPTIRLSANGNAYFGSNKVALESSGSNGVITVKDSGGTTNITLEGSDGSIINKSYIAIQRDGTTDNTKGLLLIRNGNGSSTNQSFLVNGNGAFVGGVNADGSTAAIKLNADGTSVFKGTMRVRATTNPWIEMGYLDNSSNHRIQWDSAKLKISADADNDVGSSAIQFSVDGTDVAEITPGGNASFDGKVTSQSTSSSDSDTTLATKDYVDAAAAGTGGTVAAWVNFQGSNGSIRRSFNCSGVTDYGPGNYFVNFTTGMTDANYCITASCSGTQGYLMGAVPVQSYQDSGAQTTNGFTLYTQQNGNQLLDEPYVFAAVMS